MTEAARQRWAQYAQILGPIVMASSVVFGVMTYWRSAADQRQTAALAALQEYLKLSIEHPDLANRDRAQPVDDKYKWFATHALFTAETLWRLEGDDENWQRAINSIIRQHRGYLEQGAFPGDDFQPEFVNYLRKRVSGLKSESGGQ